MKMPRGFRVGQGSDAVVTSTDLPVRAFALPRPSERSTLASTVARW